jgi:hypothetical protein
LSKHFAVKTSNDLVGYSEMFKHKCGCGVCTFICILIMLVSLLANT